MEALLLAAGYATRLYPLTLDKPKALLPAGSAPIINRILLNIKNSRKIGRVFVITNHKFYGHFKAWAAGVKDIMPVDVIDDGTFTNGDRLGAIGDIAFAIKKENIKEGLLVVGADNIFDEPLGDFLKFAESKNGSNCVGLFDLADKRLAAQYGVASIDKEGRLTDFQEKPEQPDSTLISTCIYYFPSNKLGLFEKYLSSSSNSKDASGNYIKWLSQNDSVHGYVVGGRWFDIGDIESYKKADQEFKEIPRRSTE